MGRGVFFVKWAASDAARRRAPKPASAHLLDAVLRLLQRGHLVVIERLKPGTPTPDHPNPKPPQRQSTPSDHPNPRPPRQTTPPHPARERRNTPTPDHPTIPPHRAPHSRLRGLLRPRLCQKLLCRLDDQASSYNCLRADINDLGSGCPVLSRLRLLFFVSLLLEMLCWPATHPEASDIRGARWGGMPPKQRRWGGAG